jgi:Inner membrane component of T3SS, cytoplasmic domain
MPSPNEKESIKITLEDLAGVSVPEQSLITPVSSAPGAKSYGTITQAAEQFAPASEGRGSLLLQGWFYLGVAGLLGAAAGWAIAEPGFVDGGAPRWGNYCIIPLILTLICLGFGISESLVERSAKRALLRGVLALPLGIILGFIFNLIAEMIYAVGLRICYEAGAQSARNPALWINRGIAWMVFGAAGGVVYGIVGQSSKKGKYGVIGGMIGAGLGGILFDPIAALTRGGAASRGVGFALVGIATGVGMGLVESALKDRWLYVTSGPLAGKQFILYKSETRIGSSQDCDVYLFKDPNILPRHAVIQITGTRVQLRATGAVHWAGQSIQSRVLQDGDSLQVGRYSFRYKENHRS